MSTQDLEHGLDKAAHVAEQLGFMIVSNTERTVTLSPKDKSVLKGRHNLIFDISIMDTRFVRQISGRTGTMKASEVIAEDYCLMVTLNNERDNRVFLYGVTTGLQVVRSFGLFLQDALGNKLVDTHPDLVKELTRPILETCKTLRNDDPVRKVIGWFEGPMAEQKRLPASSDTTSSTSGA